MGRFQSCAHHTHIACCIKGIVSPTTGQRDQMRDQITAHLSWIDKICHTKAAGHLNLAGIEIHADNLICPGQSQALNHIQANAAQPKDNRRAANLHLCRIDHRPNACGNTTADITNLIKRGIGTHFGQSDFW